MLKNIWGDSRGSIPPLRMPSLLPHDLCHEWDVSRRLPASLFKQIPDTGPAGTLRKLTTFNESGSLKSIDSSTYSTLSRIFFSVGLSFSSVQSLSHVQLFLTPWTAACQASLSITSSWNLLKLISIESMMPSNHLILCNPLLLLPSISLSIRVFSSELALRIRWPKY